MTRAHRGRVRAAAPTTSPAPAGVGRRLGPTLAAAALLAAGCTSSGPAVPRGRESPPSKTGAPLPTPAPTLDPAPVAGDLDVSVRVLTTGGVSKASSGVHRTPTVAPRRGALVLLWVATYVGGGDAPVPRVAGAGMRWDLVATDPPPEGQTGARRLSLFRALASSPSPGPLTIRAAPTSNWSAVEVRGRGAGRPSLAGVVQVSRQGWQTSKRVSFEGDGLPVLAGFLVGRPEVPSPGAGFEVLDHTMVASPMATLAIVWGDGDRRRLEVSWASPAHSRAIAVRLGSATQIP